ncbi:cation diffusion facilitator family transporter [Lignipirellula cremea]|uniref:Putative cation efflux system protein n=1 Tax=Lignipirellula cremea TaxID=2528010 RepID=A0A518DTT8_9BACT|nr:cation diffusion facilitator family transporter [Lignipirellula cremea]QDU95243.1 putative cation efflux system protein [Lignipirellula cremea]
MNSTGSSAKPLYRRAMRAALLGLVVNLSLGIVKLIGGIVGASFAMISDAVNSLADSLTSVVVALGLYFAQQPPDEEHPYGHTRAEAVAASNVALVIILSALYVAYEAMRRFADVHESPPVWTLWIAGANVIIKESLYRYKARVGRQTGSASIVANAWDHRSDAFCSLAVLIGLSIVRWAGPAFLWADDAAALVVAGAVLWSGCMLYRSSSSELLDPQADDQMVGRIRETAGAVTGVRAVEKLWVRKTGIEYLADIHIQVDAQLTVDEGHRIGHQVKDVLVDRYASLRDVLVHLEPFPHSHEA